MAVLDVPVVPAMIKGEVPENSLNKLSMLMSLRRIQAESLHLGFGSITVFSYVLSSAKCSCFLLRCGRDSLPSTVSVAKHLFGGCTWPVI